MDSERRSALLAIGGAQPPHEPYAAVAETHVGVVLFVGDRAYKLKKPVALGFVDFTLREARAVACRREVELNARLAPDVYLGVADLVGPDGNPCDHWVVMRRLPAARRLSSLVLEGADVRAHLDALACVLANFHEKAARGPTIDAAGDFDATLGRWEANAARLRSIAISPSDQAEVDATLRLAARYLEGRRPLLSARIVARKVCDGHGDLLAEDIFCLDDLPRVLDCLEFDDRLRYGDVLADVAFLAMDLEYLGRPDLAATFLERYRCVAGDAWPSSLAHHYVAYRAQVRALVAGVRHAQGSEGAASAARAHLELARTHLEAARVRLVVVGGDPGSGKSTLADGLAEAISATVLRSDAVRKRIAGLDPTAPAPAPFEGGLYRSSMSTATYDALLDGARAALTMGSSVVLDATFSDAIGRERVRKLATETSADLDMLACVAPSEVVAGRLAARRRDVHGSDADIAVARRLAARAAPWEPEAVLDTSGSVSAVLATALKRLGVEPPLSTEPIAS